MIPIVDRGNSLTTRAIVPTRVLVVDEEPLIRWSLCAALTAAGFDPVSAADAREAAGWAAEWPPPRVAVFDLGKPDADGRPMLTSMRAVYPDCRFLIMTTDPRPGNGSRVDGVEVIAKPFDLTRLVDRIAHLAVEPLEKEDTQWPAAR